MRRFYLRRDEDVSGTSGTGRVAEGVQFWDGACVMRWRTEVRSVTFYDSIQDLHAIHTHEGRSTIVWMDRCKVCGDDFPDDIPARHLVFNEAGTEFICDPCYQEVKASERDRPW